MCPLEVIDIKPAGEDKKDMKVVLRVKDSIPSYTLRGYFLRYAKSSGEFVKIYLPELAPSSEYGLVIPDINKSYNFEICRIDGSSVLNY